jgi:nitrogenase molybdenum-iron protein beta chain
VENALKIIDADLFMVLTGCTSEIIGDDVGEVVSQFKGASKPVLFANTPGFKGNNYEGHDWVLKALFDQYLPAADKAPAKQKGLINLFVSPPMQDAFWLGNLRELERLAAKLGLTVTTIFGHDRGLAAVNRLPAAELTVLVNPWAGLDSAQFLADRYHTPLLHYPVFPIGAFETSTFLRALGDAAGVAKATVEKVIAAEEAEYYYYIERFANTFLELRIMPKRFVTIADSQYALAVTKFLVNDLGMFPTTQYITDNPPERFRAVIDAEFANLNYGIKAAVEYGNDCAAIHDKIAQTDFGGYPLIFGSTWEREFAAALKGHFLNISYPLVDRMVINSHVAGYSGGLKLLEDMSTVGMEKLIL